MPITDSFVLASPQFVPTSTDDLLVTPTGGTQGRLADKLAVSGSGDVVGPASAADGHLAVFDGTTGKLIKDGGAVPSGGGAALSTGDISISSAQLLTAFSDPVLLIAAPGVGKQIKVLQVVYKYIFGGTPYVSDNGVATWYGPVGNQLLADNGTQNFTLSYDETEISIVTSGIGAAAALVGDQALFLASQDSDPTDGDGTMSVNVLYWI